MTLSFFNTTNLHGKELAKKDMAAQSQEVKIHDILYSLRNATEWWTRDAINREYTRRYGKRMKDQSISRALSNLSAWFCTDCRKYSTSPVCKYGKAIMQKPKLEKSRTAMWNSDEDDRVHAWRLYQPEDLFGDSVKKSRVETYGGL